VSDEPKPQFHPISALPMLAAHIGSWLPQVLKRERQFGSAAAGTLDESLIRETLCVYAEMKADLPLFEEQLRRWRIGPLSLTQRGKLSQLDAQLARIRTAIGFVLSEAERLRGDEAEAPARKSSRVPRPELSSERIDAEPKPPAA
jgi:hypothetical protein